MKNIDRRNFFQKISFSTVGAILLSAYPLNLFAGKKNKISKNIKVKLHPNSVKRTK